MLRWLTLGVWTYLGAIVVLTGMVLFLADRWWVATVALFGPRWVGLLPLAFLAPLAFIKKQRRLLGGLAVAAVLAAWPLAGLTLSWAGLASGDRRIGEMRVMSLNAGADRIDLGRFKKVLAELEVDIAMLQECGSIQDQLGKALPGWHVNAELGMCLVSRWPITAAVQRDRREVWKVGGSGAIVRYSVETPDGLGGSAVESVRIEVLNP